MPASRLLGLPRLRGRLPLVVALGVDALGSGTAGPLLLLYLSGAAGLSLGAAGTVLTGAAVLSLLVPALVGRLVARFPVRTVVIAAQLAQAAGYAGFLLDRTLPLLVAAAVLAAAGQRAFWSSVFGLIAQDTDGRDTDRWFALSGMVQAAGFAGGGLLAGLLLALPGTTPYLVALAANGASFVLSAALLARLPAAPSERDAARRTPTGSIRRDRPYLTYIAVNTALALCSVAFGTGLPVYVVRVLPVPPWIVGPLLGAATVLGATAQGTAVRLVAAWRRTRVLALAGALWTGWAALMAALPALPRPTVVPALILATLLYAAAELLHAPTSNALAAAAAPPTARARYLSSFQYSFATATMLTPALFAWLLSAAHPLPWLTIAALSLAATAALTTTLSPLSNRTSTRPQQA